MRDNSNLNKAKKAKNDEFYTQLEDIEKELIHYEGQFKGKIVLCNCDDPTMSAFWKYFHLNFAKLGLKKLISTHYEVDKPTYKMEYKGGNDNDIKVGIKTPLKSNGDFRSEECLNTLDECDIVVTNPPFSLFRECVAVLMEHKKKFLIIGNKNAVKCKTFFPLIKDNKVWTGCTNVKEFLQPDGSIKKFGNIGWFTNLDVVQGKKLILHKKYTSNEYQKYGNYNAINVNKVSEIPVDYDGVMGVPITFIDKYNPKQFEILGMTTGRKEFDELTYPTKRYINAIQHNKDGSLTNGSKMNTSATLCDNSDNRIYYTADNADGRLILTYSRILIRKRNTRHR